LTPGQNHESTAFDVALKNADENLFDVNGEPVPWPIALAGDKGYRADWLDTCLPALEILPVIPSKSNEDREARPVPFKGEAYRKRNIIERVIGWIKENRRVFSRFEKTAENFGGMIKMAFIRSYFSTSWVASVHRQPVVKQNPASWIFLTGTTSMPKAAQFTRRNIIEREPLKRSYSSFWKNTA
jgi:transposase